MTVDPNNPLAGSKFIEELGVKLLFWENGTASLELEVTDRLINRLGVAHGGVISTLLDQVMGLAWRSKGQNRIPGGTVNLNVNFIAPGNGILVAKGRLLRFTRSTAFCEGQIFDSAGNCIASSQGIFSAKLNSNSND
jgi:uncharacterized protein (TIGR00369 family)